MPLPREALQPAEAFYATSKLEVLTDWPGDLITDQHHSDCQTPLRTA